MEKLGMDKYIIVKVLCDKYKIKDNIINTVLNKKLVAGCQTYECKSKYYWNNELEEANEYLIEMRTKLSKFSEIEKIVKEIHDYDVCEISYTEILGANEEFLNWIDNSIK